MRRILILPIYFCLSGIGLTPGPQAPLPQPTKEIARYPAVIPAERLKEDRWRQRFEAIGSPGLSESYDLVFIGDSITQNWEYAGHEVWSQFYGQRHALNLGFSGDHTEHVIWRLTHGELDGLRPKVFVLMIGTNNTGHRSDPPKETAAGIKRIIELLQYTSPGSKILLVSVFPRGETPDGPKRQLNQKVNALICKFAQPGSVVWLDLWSLFLTPQGKMTREITPDFLHPQAMGYQMWAQAMEPTLKQMLGE